MQWSCKAPRRPGSTAPGRGGKCTRQQRRLAQILAPYKESLFRGRVNSAVAAGETRLRSVAAARKEARRASSPGAISPEVSGGAIAFLTDNEQSICNLMVNLLQKKSSDEAQCIMREVNHLAHSRRLLAQYSGVYAIGSSSDVGHSTEEDESARAQLIRHLRKQQERQEQEEEKARLAEKARGIGIEENEEPRIRWLRLFGRRYPNRGDVSCNMGGAQWVARTRPSSDVNARHRGNSKKECPRKNNENGQQQPQVRRRSSSAGIATERTAVPSDVLLNVPRRVKQNRGVASFDEQCADRYGGEAASNGSFPSAFLIREANGSTKEDSVRYSVSLLSPGVCEDETVERNENRAGGGVCNESEKDKAAPPQLVATVRPRVIDALPHENFTTTNVLIPQVPPSLGSAEVRNRTGLPPIKPSSTVVDGLSLPSSSNVVVQQAKLEEEVGSNEKHASDGSDESTVDSEVSTESAEMSSAAEEETSMVERKKFPWEFDD